MGKFGAVRLQNSSLWPLKYLSSGLLDFVEIWQAGPLRVRGGCGIVEFVGWCIMGDVIKDERNWRDGRLQVAMHL